LNEQFPDYADICRRCCRCNTFKGNDPDNFGTETLDGAYLCEVCKREVLGENPKVRHTHCWLADLELERLRAENEALKQMILNRVTEDARR
jgi:hypothetical protein